MSIEGRNTKKWPTRTAKLPKCGAGPHLLPSGAVVNWLGPSRLHLHHGPIDLIVGVDGQKDDVCSAYTNAVNAFDGLLNTLVEELPLLREPYLRSENCSSAFRGPVAKRMAGACEPFIRGYKSSDFITLMIAVAGSVADYVLDEMGHRYCRAYVNNGGDIAIRVPSGSKYDIGIIDEKDVFLQDSTFPEGEERSKKIPMKGRISISHNDLVGGIATSGWRGRSLSTGIADTVTVLAKMLRERMWPQLWWRML